MPLRFDDTLDTVLAADLATPLGRLSAYRQLVDLIGRRRVPPTVEAIGTLARIASDIPLDTRKAAARGLAFADPPFALVDLFARDELAVSAPVLRTARLTADEWCELMPALTPSARAILRHRRDLDAQVVRALEAYGSTDFVLSDDRSPVEPVAEPAPVEPRAIPATFSTIGSVALALPLVADAVRAEENAATLPASAANDGPVPASDGFQFETDARGVVRSADGPARASLIGLSLGLAGGAGAVRVDGVAAGAFRQRSRFRDARLTLSITGLGAGEWLISGDPAFDPGSGRFLGYRATARRAHPGETSAPALREASPAPEALRQLVHELRTPTNAIIGFSEMIALQMLGPVTENYRDHAESIQRLARELLGSIDDLDLAAKIDSDALTLRSEAVSLRAVIETVARDLSALSELRGTVIEPPAVDGAVEGDRHAIERLLGRLIATLLSAAERDERLHMTLLEEGGYCLLAIERPCALPQRVSDEDAASAALPLGTGFALRLASNLARELGGEVRFEPDRVVLRLPSARPDALRTAIKS